MATNVTGSVRSVCTAKTIRTTAVSRMPMISTEAREPVSALRRSADCGQVDEVGEAQHGEDRDHQSARSADPGELAEHRRKRAGLGELGG